MVVDHPAAVVVRVAKEVAEIAVVGREVAARGALRLGARATLKPDERAAARAAGPEGSVAARARSDTAEEQPTSPSSRSIRQDAKAPRSLAATWRRDATADLRWVSFVSDERST